MQNIGNCVLCDRLLGVRPHVRLRGSVEGQVFVEGSNVVLPVSLVVSLLVVGGQLTGFANGEVQSLIHSASGPNVREFLNSLVCPLCFPSGDPEDKDEKNEYVDGDDGDDEEEEFDGDSDKPVRVLKIEATGTVTDLTVCGLSDMKEQTEMTHDSDQSYIKDLGLYFWYDGYAQQKNLDVNVFCSVLAGTAVRGDVVLIGDIKKSFTRSTDWEDLPADWFDHRLAEVIKIVNTDQNILKELKELFE